MLNFCLKNFECFDKMVSIIGDDCDEKLRERMSCIRSKERECERLSSEHSRIVRELNRTLATFRAQCQHQWVITPPSILGYGALISSRYCMLCEKGLGDLSDVPLLDEAPTRDEVLRQKEAYWAHGVRVGAQEEELERLRTEHASLQREIQARCKHSWGRRGGSGGCYGYESRERYCINCNLTLD